MDFLKSKKVLVVDDDATTRTSHNLLLKKLGALDVFEASSVEEAYQLLMSNPIDLVVSDYVMPEETGIDLFKKMILNNMHVPFAMVTANGDTESVKEMIELGINAILVKPVTKEMLITRLGKIL